MPPNKSGGCLAVVPGVPAKAVCPEHPSIFSSRFLPACRYRHETTDGGEDGKGSASRGAGIAVAHPGCAHREDERVHRRVSPYPLPGERHRSGDRPRRTPPCNCENRPTRGTPGLCQAPDAVRVAPAGTQSPTLLPLGAPDPSLAHDPGWMMEPT